MALASDLTGSDSVTGVRCHKKQTLCGVHKKVSEQVLVKATKEDKHSLSLWGCVKSHWLNLVHLLELAEFTCSLMCDGCFCTEGCPGTHREINSQCVAT